LLVVKFARKSYVGVVEFFERWALARRIEETAKRKVWDSQRGGCERCGREEMTSRIFAWGHGFEAQPLLIAEVRKLSSAWPGERRFVARCGARSKKGTVIVPGQGRINTT
jgi:hypothetical protein